MTAASLLPTAPLLERALGTDVEVEVVNGPGTSQALGDIVRAAARDSAFRHFRGIAENEEGASAFAVSVLALLFDSKQTAGRMFDSVAGAAHLRTTVGGCDVAVETTQATNGLTSYWGFMNRGDALVVTTLDTLDTSRISIADLRAVVTAMSARLEEMMERNA